jgi:uncharacterized protein YjbI with pentapeptide repeats
MLQLTKNKQYVSEKFVRTGIIKQRIEDCRYAAVDLYETSVQESEFVDCKFSSVNWRNSKFKKVTFTNCIFDKVDMSGCEFISCAFLDCEWEEISLDRSIIGQKKLDLTGTKFEVVAGVEALAGHTLSYQQAIALLPGLLKEKEIRLDAEIV